MIGGNMIMYISTRLQAEDEVSKTLSRQRFINLITINHFSGLEFELAYISQCPAMVVKLLWGFKMNNWKPVDRDTLSTLASIQIFRYPYHLL
jgi:hypothetical protein